MSIKPNMERIHVQGFSTPFTTVPITIKESALAKSAMLALSITKLNIIINYN